MAIGYSLTWTAPLWPAKHWFFHYFGRSFDQWGWNRWEPELRYSPKFQSRTNFYAIFSNIWEKNLSYSPKISKKKLVTPLYKIHSALTAQNYLKINSMYLSFYLIIWTWKYACHTKLPFLSWQRSASSTFLLTFSYYENKILARVTKIR